MRFCKRQPFYTRFCNGADEKFQHYFVTTSNDCITKFCFMNILVQGSKLTLAHLPEASWNRLEQVFPAFTCPAGKLTKCSLSSKDYLEMQIVAFSTIKQNAGKESFSLIYFSAITAINTLFNCMHIYLIPIIRSMLRQHVLQLFWRKCFVLFK